MSKKVGQLSKKVGLEDKMIHYFYEHPSLSLTVRELSRVTKVRRSSVQVYLKKFKKQGLISPENKWVDSWQNRWRKSHYFQQKIIESGLVDYLEQELAASVIILFGSVAKGEYVRESDIDIFVECGRIKELDLTRFEKKLGYPIQLFMKHKLRQLPADLLRNVINGVKLKGYIDL